MFADLKQICLIFMDAIVMCMLLAGVDFCGVNFLELRLFHGNCEKLPLENYLL